MFSRPFSPPTLPDGSLTVDNVFSTTANIPLWSSEDSNDCLDMPEEVHEEIVRRYDGDKGKKELIATWLAGHPCPSWYNVVDLLRVLEDEERGRVGAVKEAEETYLKSKLPGMHILPHVPDSVCMYVHACYNKR